MFVYSMLNCASANVYTCQLGNPLLECIYILHGSEINGYTSVSRLINTEPSELLRLQLSEPIASESAMSTKSSEFGVPSGEYAISRCCANVEIC